MIWSTINWDYGKKEVGAWMPKTFITNLVEKGLKCYLYLTNIWLLVVLLFMANSKKVRGAVKQCRKWNGSQDQDKFCYVNKRTSSCNIDFASRVLVVFEYLVCCFDTFS